MPSLEEEIQKIIQEAIDREIVEEISIASYVDQGWHMVTISATDMEDIGPWMQENIRGNWRGYTNRWLFEFDSDAILFKMRWG